MEIIARTVYRVIAMHRSQYGSSFAMFSLVAEKSDLEKDQVVNEIYYRCRYDHEDCVYRRKVIIINIDNVW